VSTEVELWMLEGSEFQTVGAAMLKLRETKVVWTCGTNSREQNTLTAVDTFLNQQLSKVQLFCKFFLLRYNFSDLTNFCSGHTSNPDVGAAVAV